MKLRRVARIVTWVGAIGIAACNPARRAPEISPRLDAASATSAPFEEDIAKFEAADLLAPPKGGGVLFVGSSTIRMWNSLAADFPGVGVIQRGFGGSELSDVVRYAPRIVVPYRPRLIVLYAGDNDLAAGKSAEVVFNEYRQFVSLVRRALPDTRIAFVSIKPSGSRVALLPQMRSANEMIRRFAATDPHLLYLDVFTLMLGPDGAPREELFLADRLHMNSKGYAIWKEALYPIVRDASPP